MRKKLPVLIQYALITVGFLLFIGLGIETTVTLPPYALVFLDDQAKTYIAAPCLNEWLQRPGEHYSLARRSTSSEAQRLHYAPDDKCREAGGYIDDGPSLTGLLLIKLGILPAKKYWWDEQTTP